MLKSTKMLGFSLAELIIAIGIVGIVANMTLPRLMTSVQNHQFIAALKNDYTTINQALRKMSDDYGCPGDLKCTPLGSGNTTTAGDGIVQYLKVIKNCGNMSSTSNKTCFADYVSDHYTGSSRYNGWSSGYNFITADGSSYELWALGANCVNSGSALATSPLTKICGIMYIDVNGLKGPNNVGRDIFEYMITTAKGPLLYPWGARDGGDAYITGTTFNSCYTTNPDGFSCSGRIMDEGWAMNY